MVFYFEFSLAHKCTSFLLIGCGDNFRFGITTFNRKALHNFSGQTSFYQDKSKPYYNSLSVIVDISPTLSSIMGLIKKYHKDHEQEKNRYKLSQKRSRGLISLRYTNYRSFFNKNKSDYQAIVSSPPIPVTDMRFIFLSSTSLQ